MHESGPQEAQGVNANLHLRRSGAGVPLRAQVILRIYRGGGGRVPPNPSEPQ